MFQLFSHHFGDCKDFDDWTRQRYIRNVDDKIDDYKKKLKTNA